MSRTIALNQIPKEQSLVSTHSYLRPARRRKKLIIVRLSITGGYLHIISISLPSSLCGLGMKCPGQYSHIRSSARRLLTYPSFCEESTHISVLLSGDYSHIRPSARRVPTHISVLLPGEYQHIRPSARRVLTYPSLCLESTHISVLLPGALSGLAVDLAVEYSGLAWVHLRVLRLLAETLQTAHRCNTENGALYLIITSPSVVNKH